MFAGHVAPDEMEQLILSFAGQIQMHLRSK